MLWLLELQMRFEGRPGFKCRLVGIPIPLAPYSSFSYLLIWSVLFWPLSLSLSDPSGLQKKTCSQIPEISSLRETSRHEHWRDEVGDSFCSFYSLIILKIMNSLNNFAMTVCVAIVGFLKCPVQFSLRLRGSRLRHACWSGFRLMWFASESRMTHHHPVGTFPGFHACRHMSLTITSPTISLHNYDRRRPI